VILITGAGGQDGQILSKLFELLDIPTLRVLSVRSERDSDQPAAISAKSADFMDLNRVPKGEISVLIHLAASSSVADSVREPLRSYRTNTLLAIEAIEFVVKNEIPIIFPSSSEVFSRAEGLVSEEAPHEPHTPYGFAKSKSAELIGFYRQKGLLRGSILTMFNHESPLRPDSYLSKTIANQVMAARQNKANSIQLNALSVSKDFSWAPDLVALLALPKLWESNQDFVLGSGQVTSVKDMAQAAADRANLKIDILETGSKRELDVHPAADSTRAREAFNWQAQFSGVQMISRFIDLELEGSSLAPEQRKAFFTEKLAVDALQAFWELK